MSLNKCNFKSTLCSIGVLSSVLMLPNLALAVQKRSNNQVQSKTATAEQLLAHALFYYNNNDVTDAAAKQFKQLIKQYPETVEAEEGQYYLGSYYRRKYYITKEKWRREFPESLSQAVSEYQAYIAKYWRKGSGKWLSDAQFYLSLVYMESGYLSGAEEHLSRIVNYESGRDPTVYIDQLVWSTDSVDMIDFEFGAKDLAEFTRGRVFLRPADFDMVLPTLRRWCQDYKSRKSNAKI